MYDYTERLKTEYPDFWEWWSKHVADPEDPDWENPSEWALDGWLEGKGVLGN